MMKKKMMLQGTNLRMMILRRFRAKRRIKMKNKNLQDSARLRAIRMLRVDRKKKRRKRHKVLKSTLKTLTTGPWI